MNILFLSCWYPSKENPLKGIFVKEHATAIKNSGAAIVVLALNVVVGSSFFQKKVEKFTDDQGIETHIIHIQSRLYKWIYINPFLMYSILKEYFGIHIFPSFKPDVFHSNILYPCAVIGDRLSVKYRKPHVITEHWSKIDKYMSKNLLSFQGKKAYRNAKYIIVVSEFLRSKVLAYLFDPSQIKIIPNVIDTSVFSFSPKVPDKEKIIFSCVASWKIPKQPMLFVKALENISKASSQKIELNFVGEGPQLDEIKKLKLNYKIQYHGILPKPQIANILRKSDFFLHASLIETFSMVVAEALATGTPVIASNVGALPELVNSANGILAENTVLHWETAILSALKIPFNCFLISEGIKNKFSRESVSIQFNEVYKKINLDPVI